MKYTIEGFNQRNAIAMNLNTEDLVFLRWFIDFKETSDMQKKYIPNINDMGYWVSYKYVIKELPILFSTPPHMSNENYSTLSVDEKKKLNKNWINACKKKLQRMLSGNLNKVITRDIDREKTINPKGQSKIDSKVYLCVNSLTFKFLVSDSYGIYTNTDEKTVDNPVDNSPVTTGQKCPPITGQKCPPVTTGQKCPINTSTNNLYSMYVCTSSEGKNITHELFETLKEKSNSKSDPKAWLEKTIKIQIKKGIYTLDAYKESLIEYGKQFRQASKKSKNTSSEGYPKTNFHNFSQSMDNYSIEELDEIIAKSQVAKFGTDKTHENNYIDLREKAIEILQAETVLTVNPNDKYWADEINKKIQELRGF
ncbi:hypothetical protein [Romboutsia sp. 1001285H_161024_C4]|uniref:hypothetical protein n=1 Tax=Romboutsia sp. 1001285H_161024_C4 TaxID=2787109 RepID=UPI00189B22B0|nr:hypothetical protein [Romboutsia sp. 1001285H_161024_C4]